jgi:hypothetical protein
MQLTGTVGNSRGHAIDEDTTWPFHESIGKVRPIVAGDLRISSNGSRIATVPGGKLLAPRGKSRESIGDP